MRGSDLRVEWRCSAGPYGEEHAELWIGQESLGAEESYTLSLDQIRRFRLFVVHNDFDRFEQLLMSVLKLRGGASTAHLIRGETDHQSRDLEPQYGWSNRCLQVSTSQLDF